MLWALIVETSMSAASNFVFALVWFGVKITVYRFPGNKTSDRFRFSDLHFDLNSKQQQCDRVKSTTNNTYFTFSPSYSFVHFIYFHCNANFFSMCLGLSLIIVSLAVAIFVVSYLPASSRAYTSTYIQPDTYTPIVRIAVQFSS